MGLGIKTLLGSFASAWKRVVSPATVPMPAQSAHEISSADPHAIYRTFRWEGGLYDRKAVFTGGRNERATQWLAGFEIGRDFEIREELIMGPREVKRQAEADGRAGLRNTIMQRAFEEHEAWSEMHGYELC